VSDPDPPRPDGGLSLLIEASAAGLAAAQPGLRRALDESGVAQRVADRAEVVVEEVVMNVAMHAFDDSERHAVALRATPQPSGGCELVFEDAGRPFDPIAAVPPGPKREPDEVQVGGLGLVLIRRFASELAYERLPAGLNRLRVVLTSP
jgi:anti-sigma regulatory factor (Ser/Thr protein kinase)